MAAVRWAVRVGAMVLLIGGLSAAGALPASAATSSLPHVAVGGFATPNGGVFSLVFADGSLRPGRAGDAFSLPLNAGMTGGAIDPANDGYWEVGADGGVFSYGASCGGVDVDALEVWCRAEMPSGT